jgi:hypothetical protein
LEGHLEQTTEKTWCFIFLLLATLAHELVLTLASDKCNPWSLMWFGTCRHILKSPMSNARMRYPQIFPLIQKQRNISLNTRWFQQHNHFSTRDADF